MKKFAVCGNPIKHSISPIIFKQFFANNNFDAYYSRLLTANPSDAINLFKQLELDGMNVTSPLKKSIKSHCTKCENTANQIDAVNTVVKFNEDLLGFNTDWEGVLLSLRSENIDLNDQKILIIGAGNAAAAAIFGIKTFYPSANITIFNKSEENAKQLAEKFQVLFHTVTKPTTKNLANFDIIIVTIPTVEKYLQNVDFNKNSILFFADYTNREFFNSLKSKNHKLISGEKWLINQAIPAFEYFYGNDEFCRKVEIFEEIISEYFKNFENANIFLTGFCGSGKTFIGKKLAQKLNKKFIDTDEMIENRLNKNISAIFEIYGEEYFRKEETDILANICKEKNQIISLGGGTILSEQNQKYIRNSGGFTVYIFSDLATSLNRIDINSRPLLYDKTADEINNIYSNRKDLYFANSDLIILNSSENEDKIVDFLFDELRK